MTTSKQCNRDNCVIAKYKNCKIENSSIDIKTFWQCLMQSKHPFHSFVMRYKIKIEITEMAFTRPRSLNYNIIKTFYFN